MKGTVPDRIVIEISTSKYGAARAVGSNTIVVYGGAWGYLLHVCDISGYPVSAVEANEWTKGWAKKLRAALAQANYRSYDPRKDPGGDVADAICLGEWFLNRKGK